MERQRLTPKEIIKFAHILRDDYSGKAGDAKNIVGTVHFRLLDGMTIRQASDGGRIRDAYGAYVSFSEGAHI